MPDLNGGFREGVWEKVTLQVMDRTLGIPRECLGALPGMACQGLVWFGWISENVLKEKIWKCRQKKADVVHFIPGKGF